MQICTFKPGTKIFILDKKYFVQAEGPGMNVLGSSAKHSIIEIGYVVVCHFLRKTMIKVSDPTITKHYASFLKCYASLSKSVRVS